MRPIYDLATAFAAQVHEAGLESTRMYEAAVGIVTDNKDPSKLGRVKVKIPVLSDQDSTWWCPIIMLGAGKNRGWFFIPELNDEVLLMFEHGDITRPLVVGALWGGKDKPPDKNPGKVPHRAIKSRAGSRILFDDDKNQIIIEDGGGKGRITFDSGSNKITIEALDGDVCFQAPADELKIVASTVEITAKQNVEINAGSTMAWGSDGASKIGSANITWSGSKANENCGTAQSPAAPSATPKDTADPYGS
jgi:uncharacterized protein involved in type VI secretion and phage assembly